MRFNRIVPTYYCNEPVLINFILNNLKLITNNANICSHMFKYCDTNHYSNAISIVILKYNVTMFSRYADTIYYYILSHLSDKDIIYIYEKFEGHTPFIISNDNLHNWLHQALKHRRGLELIKFFLDKGHYYVNDSIKYDNYYIRNIHGINQNHVKLFTEHSKGILFDNSLRGAFMQAVITV